MTARPPTDGELVAFADDLLLVDSFEVLTIKGFAIGVPGSQMLVTLRLDGRVNRTKERRTVNLALSPDGAANLMRTMVESYSGAFGPRDAFGRSTGE